MELSFRYVCMGLQPQRGTFTALHLMRTFSHVRDFTPLLPPFDSGVSTQAAQGGRAQGAQARHVPRNAATTTTS